MIYRVSHLTEYHYSAPVTLAHHLARMSPRETVNQRFRRHELRIDPKPAVLHGRFDSFGNWGSIFIVQETHQRLLVEATSEVELSPRSAFDPAQTPAWEAVRDGLSSDLSLEGLETYQYLFDSGLVQCSPELADYAKASFFPGRPILGAVLDLTRRIFADFCFDPTATTVSTPLRTVLSSRRGVCQDFAHLQIGCLRSMGLAARYVSGYIETNPPPGEEKLHGADASHAWVSVYCPGLGWVDFDPTNNLIVSDQHITVAWGRDYGDVSPLRGVILGGGQHNLRVAVSVHALEARGGLMTSSAQQQQSAQQQ